MSLVFSDTSTKQGLIQACESSLFGDNGYGKISGDTDLLADFTRRLNDGLNRVASLIMQADGRWQWDDNNNADYPISSTGLVADQQDYTFTVSHLKIIRVEVKDQQGNWHLVTPFDQRDVNDKALTEFLAESSLPQFYDKLANSLFLYPRPNFSQDLSLKVYFQRPPVYFSATGADTRVPGFNSLYHNLVALIACRDYALDRQLSSAKGLAERVQLGEQDVQDAYSLRSKDEHISLAARPKKYR